MRLWYVDPTGQRAEGETVSLQAHEQLMSAETAHDGFQTIQERFAEGLSELGAECVYADFQTVTNPAAIMREWIFEITRRSRYADYVPSRFQSLRAYETRHDATQQARQTLPTGAYGIFELDVDEPSGPFFTGHLQGTTVPDMMYHAEAYWDGIPHAAGTREYLLKAPVTLDQQDGTVSATQ